NCYIINDNHTGLIVNIMKKKSNKKFIPGGQKQTPESEKQGSAAKGNSATAPSSGNKNTGRKPVSHKSPGKPWYTKPVSIIVFAFAAVAIIAAVSGYFAGQKVNNSPQNSQNSTPPAPAATTPQNPAKIVISEAEVTEVAAASITIKWKTNIPCIGEAHATYTNRELTISSFPDDSAVTEHTALIAGLAPSTSYKIEIISKDSKGNKEVLALDKSYQTITPRTAMGLAAGDTAPDFSLADSSGKITTLSNYKGKWVVIVFWDLACTACKEELPYINSYFKGLSDANTDILTVSYKGQTVLVESYMRSQKFSFPVLLDVNGAVCEQFTIAAYPTTILIDGDRKIVKIKQAAFKTVQEISDFVQEGMKGK
ncbi:MAG: hypothetical protein A2Z02_02120, partial [Chloroflexi bacterium RBG_16_48_7]